MPRPLALTSSAGGCVHERQHHPGSPVRMLPCAWPGCGVGVAEDQLFIDRAGIFTPLLVQRLSLVLDGVDRVFFWHPCGSRWLTELADV